MITEAGVKAALRRLGKNTPRVEMSDGGGRGEGRLVLTARSRGGEELTVEWYAKWWRNGRPKMLKIGTYPTMSISDARKTYREEYGPQISAGKDPKGPRARRERRGVTVTDLFRAYVDDMKAAGKASWRVAENALLGPNGKAGAAAAIGSSVRAADVKPEDIREHLADIYDRGSIVAADMVRTYIHAAFAWAMKSANSYKGAAAKVDWGLSFNPCSAIPADTDAKRARDRNLKPAEVRVFWAWLEGVKHDRIASRALQLQICLGQRVTEVLGLTDESYDRAEKMLDWSKTKNGLPHTIPLPQRAIDILDGIPPNSAGLYFPRQNRPRDAATPFSAEKVVRDFLKDHPDFEHFTPRDLRRTWKTLSGAAGLSKEIRDRIQNHARTDVSSRHYDRYDYLAEKRAAMKAWELYLDRVLSGELDNPVAQFVAHG